MSTPNCVIESSLIFKNQTWCTTHDCYSKNCPAPKKFLTTDQQAVIYNIEQALSDFNWIETIDETANFQASIRGLEFCLEYLTNEWKAK